MSENFYFGIVTYNILTITLLYWGYYQKNIKRDQRYVFNVLCCIIIFSIGSIGNIIFPDYYEYKDIVDIVSATKDPFVHIEIFWINLIKIIGNNHTLFIFILQAFSCLLLFIITLISSPFSLPIFFGSLMGIGYYSLFGGRGVLFYMSFYLSFILFSKGKNILGILILLLCCQLHKAIYIAIPILLLSFIFTSKNNIKQITYLIFICCFCLRLVLNSFIKENELLISQLPGHNYMQQEENLNVVGNVIWRLLPNISTIIKYILSILVLIQTYKIVGYLSKVQKQSYFLLYWSIICSLGFYLIGLPDPTIANRCFGFAYLPLCYIISFLPNYFRNIRYERTIYLVSIFLLLLINNISLIRVSRINHIEAFLS